MGDFEVNEAARDPYGPHRMICSVAAVALVGCGARSEIAGTAGGTPEDASTSDVSQDVAIEAHDSGAPLLAFVTSAQFTPPAIGGLDGADAICDAEAKAANLGGHFLAWLSDSHATPLTRFESSATPFARVDGVLIATSFADLVSGSLAAPLDMTLDGQELASGEFTWTATRADGTLAATDSTCSDWTSLDPNGSALVGDPTKTDERWTNAGTNHGCSAWAHHLYCFQQP